MPIKNELNNLGLITFFIGTSRTSMIMMGDTGASTPEDCHNSSLLLGLERAGRRSHQDLHGHGLHHSQRLPDEDKGAHLLT